MLPSLGFQEIILLGIIALVVVGPKDLPLLLRKLGKWTAKLRGMAQEFRTGFDELARQAELDELRREVDALRRTTNLHSVTNELTKPLGTLESYASAPSPRYDTPPPAPVEPPAPAAPETPGGEAVEAPSVSEEQPVMRSTAP
jgi:sec-independent protein translocase protein TatB